MGVVERPASSFGVTVAMVRSQLEALNGSLLNLAEDEEGPFWTYRHPTVSDAFASHIAKSPELVEIYLRGAIAETIVREVVCAGVQLYGATVVVPTSMFDLLADRIGNLPSHVLASFISYRSNPSFTKALLGLRPDIWKRLDSFYSPLKDDMDVDLIAALHSQGLLSEERRIAFVGTVRTAANENADDSFLASEKISAMLTDSERAGILEEVEVSVLGKIEQHVQRVRQQWDQDYDPNDYFDELRFSVHLIADALSSRVDVMSILAATEKEIRSAVCELESNYEPPSSSPLPPQQSAAKSSSLVDLFRDVDE